LLCLNASLQPFFFFDSILYRNAIAQCHVGEFQWVRFGRNRCSALPACPASKHLKNKSRLWKRSEMRPKNFACRPGLGKALTNRNNFMVAKAADLVRELTLNAFTDDLLAACNWFFDHPARTDPQCREKNAISRALAAPGYH
jgi:hypothetical protein